MSSHSVFLGRRCRVCRALLVPSTVGPTRGARGYVQVEFPRVPCFACPAGHERVFIGDDFQPSLWSEIWSGSPIPVADMVGLLRARHLCVQCRAELTDRSRAPHTATARMRPFADMGPFAPFEMTLTAPAATCPACGRVQLVYTESMVDVEDAVDAAFKAFGLRP